MNNEVMTLERLASLQGVDDLVGARYDKRWGRASLTTRRSDGHSIASWFETYEPDERVAMVRVALLDAAPWRPLLRVEIPKRPGSTETRSIDMPVVHDAARLYVLQDWLVPHAETELTKVASAYRRGVRMSQVILNAHRRTQSLPFAGVLDVQAFYDSLSWSMLDDIIGDLPADEHVQRFLRALVRVGVIERTSGRLLERERGIPQGVGIAPVLANLAMNDFDQSTSHALSRLGVVIRRWCDDILMLGPTPEGLRAAVDIVRDRLARIGLRTKPGMGEVVDVRMARITWLGISFGPGGLDVPTETIDKKVMALQTRLDHGILDQNSIEDSLVSLDQHYRRIISPAKTQELITSIRERLTIPSALSTRREVQDLEHLIDERHHRGPLASWNHPGGNPDGIDNRRRGHSDQGEQPWEASVMHSGLAASMAKFSEASNPGAPVGSASRVAEKSEWRIGAIARGHRRAHVIARETRSGQHAHWQVDLPDSASQPEAVVLALADGLDRLRGRGAESVTIVVTDETLAGYVWRGWRPRSLRMHGALARLLRHSGALRVMFDARSNRQRP